MRLIDADALKKLIIKHLCVNSENYLLPAEKSIYDLIDKQPTVDLLKEQQEAREHLSKGVGLMNKLLDKKNAEIARLIEGQPVHCKDCEIRDKGMACVCSTGDDWFCADGKQKERGDHG